MSIDYTSFKFAKKPIKNRKTEKVNDVTYQQVIKACKGKCVLCGIQTQLELHHINGRGKELTNNVRNCVMLCLNCHRNVVHQNLKKYRPILNELAKKIYGGD